MGDPGAHAQLGDQLIWFAIPLPVLSAALVWLDRRRPIGPSPDVAHDRPNGVIRAIAALAVVAALAASVQLYRVGESGARAAWGDQVTSTK